MDLEYPPGRVGDVVRWPDRKPVPVERLGEVVMPGLPASNVRDLRDLGRLECRRYDQIRINAHASVGPCAGIALLWLGIMRCGSLVSPVIPDGFGGSRHGVLSGARGAPR